MGHGDSARVPGGGTAVCFGLEPCGATVTLPNGEGASGMGRPEGIRRDRAAAPRLAGDRPCDALGPDFAAPSRETVHRSVPRLDHPGSRPATT